MSNIKIIAQETFGPQDNYRLDVLATRFGDYEFFVLLDGEVVRQASDIVVVTKGLESVPGIGDAVERAAGRI